jgi:hypothetical protein
MRLDHRTRAPMLIAMTARSLVTTLAAMLLAAACTSAPTMAPSLALHTVPFNGNCRGVGGGGDMTIRGDAADPWLAWEIGPGGGRQDIWWPAGYTARFNPKVEILDPTGRVVLRDGDLIPAGACSEGVTPSGQPILLVVPPSPAT